MYHILPILPLRFDYGMAYSIILTKKQVQSDLFILLRFITGETSLRVDANLKNICVLWIDPKWPRFIVFFPTWPSLQGSSNSKHSLMSTQEIKKYLKQKNHKCPWKYDLKSYDIHNHGHHHHHHHHHHRKPSGHSSSPDSRSSSHSKLPIVLKQPDVSVQLWVSVKHWKWWCYCYCYWNWYFGIFVSIYCLPTSSPHQHHRRHWGQSWTQILQDICPRPCPLSLHPGD